MNRTLNQCFLLTGSDFLLYFEVGRPTAESPNRYFNLFIVTIQYTPDLMNGLVEQANRVPHFTRFAL